MASCLQINIYQKHPYVGLSLKASGVRGDQVVICKFTSLSAVLQLFFHIKCWCSSLCISVIFVTFWSFSNINFNLSCKKKNFLQLFDFNLRNIIIKKDENLCRVNFRFLVACISTWCLSCTGFSIVNSSLFYLNKKKNACNVSGVWTSENGTRFLVGSTLENGSSSVRLYLKWKLYLITIFKERQLAQVHRPTET